MKLSFLLCAFASLLFTPFVHSAENTADYAAVHAIFDQYCLDCHEAKEPEANLVLETFESLMKGGENGPSVIPGKSAKSLLVKMVEGTIEKEGKKIIMPPGKKSKKLNAAEIAAIKAWIDAGAKPPAEAIVKQLVVPKIAPKGEPRRSVFALAHSAPSKLLASAQHGQVDLIAMETRAVVRSLTGHVGSVNAVAFAADGAELFSVSGENALRGEIKHWRVKDGFLIRHSEGHKDAIYAVAVSPDGKTLATGSYDQDIKLWSVATGKEIKTLHGHNGAVFGLAFRPDGKILASASADRTVKLWNVEKGERTDTLSQPIKDVYCVAFSRDGKKLYAGGVDSRIRIWRISEAAVETTNPLLESKFAHEGSILRLQFSDDGKRLLSSADDRTVKLWDVAAMREALVLEKQPDWVAGLGFADKSIVVGRMDGTVGFYDEKGKLLGKDLTTASKSAR